MYKLNAAGSVKRIKSRIWHFFQVYANRIYKLEAKHSLECSLRNQTDITYIYRLIFYFEELQA